MKERYTILKQYCLYMSYKTAKEEISQGKLPGFR